jgi:hypothetical protein
MALTASPFPLDPESVPSVVSFSFRNSISVRHRAERPGDHRSHQWRAYSTTIHDAELQVNSYPASERMILDVERGRICNAILPMPRARTLSAGDSVIFALAYSHAGQETCYVKCGDSVCVSVTDVIDAGVTDPATGQALFRLYWNPPGQGDSPSNVVKRVVKSRTAHGMG